MHKSLSPPVPSPAPQSRSLWVKFARCGRHKRVRSSQPTCPFCSMGTRRRPLSCAAGCARYLAQHEIAALAPKMLSRVGLNSLLRQPGHHPVIPCRTRILPVKLTRPTPRSGPRILTRLSCQSACMHTLFLGDMHGLCCRFDRFPCACFFFEVIVAMTLSRSDRHHPREQVLWVGGG